MKKFFGWLLFFSIVGLVIYIIKKCPQCKEHFSLCKERFHELFKHDEEEEDSNKKGKKNKVND